jgi:beta-lactamase regulating signal transducer with metallopeptidase domain
MHSLIDDLNALSAAVTGLAWAIVWQSTLLAAIIAVVCRLLRHSSPSVRYWLWQIVAIKLLLMPFWTAGVALPSWAQRSEEAARDVDPLSGRESSLNVSLSVGAGESIPLLPAVAPALAAVPRTWYRQWTWQSLLLLCWLIILVAQLVRLQTQRLRLNQLLRQATAATDTGLLAEVQALCDRIALRKVPDLLLTDREGSPFVCGWLRPTIILPKSLIATLAPGQLSLVLLHELAHIKRHDLVWGWLLEIARIVYFFHPLVYWLGNRIRLERELACDQLAMAGTGEDAAAYAATLVQVMSHACEPELLRAAASSFGLSGAEGLPSSQQNQEQQS